MKKYKILILATGEYFPDPFDSYLEAKHFLEIWFVGPYSCPLYGNDYEYEIIEVDYEAISNNKSNHPTTSST